MKGTNGREPRRWWHLLGRRRSVEWATHEVSDCAVIGVGRSERGIAVQAAVFIWSQKEFASATVYMDANEANDLARKLMKAIEDDSAGVPIPKADPPVVGCRA